MARRRKNRSDEDRYDDDRYDDHRDSHNGRSSRHDDDGRDSRYDDDDSYDNEEDYDDGYDDNDDYDYDDYDEMVEDDRGINLASKAKAGRYRIISLVFLLIVIGCSFAVFAYKKNVATTNRTSCWTYQNIIESKIQEYVRKNGLSANPAYVEDVPGISGIKFECPDGGGFTWNPVDGTYSCSEHGHYPDQFVTPESQVTSTQVQAVTEE